MRTCKICGKKYLVNTFPKAGEKNGKIFYRHKCNKCYVVQKKQRRNKNREAILLLKKQLKCNRCGNSDYRVLEFHHWEDNKESSVASMYSASIPKIKKEIEKCETLCANCHRIEHFK